MKKILIFIGLLTSTVFLFSQITELEHFEDSALNSSEEVTSSIKKNDGIIYTGILQQGSSVTSVIPFISRIDTAGNVIWSTLKYNSTVLHQAYWNSMFDGNDGYIYALASEYDQNINWQRYLWKINEETGEISYHRLFHQSGRSTSKIRNYDSTYYLAMYEHNLFSGASSYLALLKKTDGDTVKVKYEPTGTWYNFDVTTDKAKNVITAFGGKVIKYNGHNFNEIIWERSYNGGPSEKMEHVEQLYVDDYNELYLLGLGGIFFSSTDDKGVFKKVDINTGDEIWSSIAVSSGMTLSDFKDRNGFLYFSHKNDGSGSIPYRYFFNKVNKQTGNLAVSSSHFIAAPGTISLNGVFQQSNSVTVDCNGDAYLNGSYALRISSSQYTNHWGVIKVDGLSGNQIYNRSFGTTNGNGTYLRNEGISSYTYEDKIIFMGTLVSNGKNSVTLIEYDGISNVTKSIKKISNGYKLPSEVLGLVSFNDSLLVLKKEGGLASMDLYNKLGVKVYSKRLAGLVTSSGNLVVDGAKVIVALAQNTGTNIIPYYVSNSPLAIRAYEIDIATGATTNAVTKNFNNGIAQIEEIKILNGKPCVFFSDYAFNYSKWETTGLSNRINLYSGNSHINKVSSNKVFQTDSSLFLFKNRSVTEILDRSNFPITRSGYPLTGSYNFTDITELNDTIYAVGENQTTNKPSVIAYNFKNDSVLWMSDFSFNGKFTKVTHSNNELFVSGQSDTGVVVYSLSIDSARVNWRTSIDSLPIPNGEVYDMEVNLVKNELAIVGAVNVSGITKIGFVSVMDISGNVKTLEMFRSVSNFPTFANEIVAYQDSGYWFGGAINRLGSKEEGFLYALNTKPSLITSQLKSQGSLNKENSLLIYPNPVLNNLYVKGLKEGNFKYRIFDMTGRQITQANQNNSREIDVANFAKGAYFISIQQNSLTQNFTFIKL